MKIYALKVIRMNHINVLQYRYIAETGISPYTGGSLSSTDEAD